MTLNESLKNQVKAQAPALLTEFGFVCSEGSYAADHFGDSHLVLVGPVIMIRLTREKGVVTLEFGSSRYPAEFWDYGDVRNLLSQSGEQIDLSSLINLEPFLRRHWVELTGIFGSDYESMRQRLETIKSERVNRWRAWLRGGNAPPS